MDPCDRLAKYVSAFAESLKTLKTISKDAIDLVDLALAYFSDSKYYMEKGDCITGIATISYAEGIIDTLKRLGLVEWEWQKPKETIVFAAGSFDVLHPGHIKFLEWASKLGSKLYVVVARDENYVKFKGSEPIFSETERTLLVNAIRYVYKALPGSLDDFAEPLMELRPQIIALGPDQEISADLLKALGQLEIRPTITKMSERVPNYSSSRMKDRVCRVWCK